jgi:AraC-like DNA-binding protein
VGAGAQHVEIEFVVPAEPLRPYVSGYQCVAVETPSDRPIEDLFYPGWANLRFTLEGEGWRARLGAATAAPVPPAALFGVSAHAARVQVWSGRLVGAGVTPLGWASMFGVEASRFADRISPLEELLGDEAEALWSRLAAVDHRGGWTAILDDWFMTRLADAPAPPAELVDIQRLLIDPKVSTVEEVAAAAGVSTRHISRVSLRYFGLPPKLLIRRARFMRTLMMLRADDPRPWAHRLDPGYHDQSHFVRDCKFFLDLSPTAFFALPRPILEASTRTRAAAVGAPVQALHPAAAP